MAKQWYEGGTLHYATVAEWQNASYTNKTATAGSYGAVEGGRDREKPNAERRIWKKEAPWEVQPNCTPPQKGCM